MFDTGVVERLTAWARQVSQANAAYLAGVAAVAEASPNPEFAGFEVSTALTLTPQAANALVDLAHTIVRRLPALHAAMTAGDVDLAKARVIVDGVMALDLDLARSIVAAILPLAPGLTTGQLRTRLARLVIQADPQAAVKRRRVRIRDRRVELLPTEDCCATLLGLNLPAEGALAASNRLTVLARALKRAGDPRSMDQLRADTFLNLLQGNMCSCHSSCHPPTTSPAHRSGDKPTSPARRTAGAPTSSARRSSGKPTSTAAHQPDGANGSGSQFSGAGNSSGRFSGADESGGQFRGADFSGSPSAGAGGSGSSFNSARSSGSQFRASGDSGSQFRDAGDSGSQFGDAGGAAQHQTGAATGTSQHRTGGANGSGGSSGGEPTDNSAHACHPPANPGRRSGGVELTGDLETLARLADNPGDLAGYGPVIADIARQVAAQQRHSPWTFTIHDKATGQVYTGATRRRPTEALARHVRARDRTCRAPGCRRPAIYADIDHTIAYELGGLTVAGNLGVLCRYHHRAKHEGWWLLVQVKPGVFVWRSPLGRRYTVYPSAP